MKTLNKLRLSFLQFVNFASLNVDKNCLKNLCVTAFIQCEFEIQILSAIKNILLLQQ